MLPTLSDCFDELDITSLKAISPIGMYWQTSMRRGTASGRRLGLGEKDGLSTAGQTARVTLLMLALTLLRRRSLR